nr:TetR/AcrR family transcriptional regulator [Maliibacterium massiliense]
MKKQPEVTEQTKRNLRDAFWRLYTQKPLDRISIKEITDLAGYNRGTFYLYYRDVYDIFEQIEDDLLGQVADLLQSACTEENLFDLSRHMGYIVQMARTYSSHVTVLLSDRGDPRFVTRLKELVWPLLRRYVVPSAGRSDYEMALLAEYYLSGLFSIITKWLADGQPMPIDQLIDFVIAHVFAMSTPAPPVDDLA